MINESKIKFDYHVRGFSRGLSQSQYRITAERMKDNRLPLHPS